MCPMRLQLGLHGANLCIWEGHASLSVSWWSYRIVPYRSLSFTPRLIPKSMACWCHRTALHCLKYYHVGKIRQNHNVLGSFQVWHEGPIEKWYDRMDSFPNMALSAPIWETILGAQSGIQSGLPHLGTNLTRPIWESLWGAASGRKSEHPLLGDNLGAPSRIQSEASNLGKTHLWTSMGRPIWEQI